MKNTKKNFDIICVVGPTASGKSELAVKLAKKYNGEIISGDSRQIYRGMNIGSGKVEGKWISVKKPDRVNNNKTNSSVRKKSIAKDTKKLNNKKIFVYKNIPHYLIDEASPSVQYSAARFQKKARATTIDILKRGKLPIICGGTGHWIDSVVYDSDFPAVKPNLKFRKQLSKLTTEQLFAKLKKLDPVRSAEIDSKNPHRLIRALEIVITTGKPVPKRLIKTDGPKKTFKNYKILWLGINPGMEVLEKNITKRLHDRLKIEMLKEVKNLHQPKIGRGLSWKKLESFGLEYKFCALFLQNKISKEDMNQGIITTSRKYAKRQMTWWKRNPEIQWSEKADKFLKKSN